MILSCFHFFTINLFLLQPLYPTVSNWFATRTHYSEVSTYDEAI
ncbi:class C sortase, partial [Bacillus sp. D-CC]